MEATRILTLASKVIDIATKRIVSIDEKKSVIEAAVMMFEHDISSIVVTSNDEAVGIVTERDMLRRALIQGTDPGTVSIGTIMSKPLITIDGEASLGDATTLMLERKVRHLLVISQGKIAGICTNNDVERQVNDIFSILARL